MNERLRTSLAAAALAALAALHASAAALAQAPAGVADINAQYKDPNLEVQVWVERFEVEGREAYDHREQIADALGLERGDAVADVGAGTGLYEPLLAERVGPEGKVYAVDIVPKFVEHIRARAAERGLTQVQAVLGTDRSTNLPPASVDVVLVCDAYHHFEDYAAMLASIHQALRPGGELVIVDFDRVEGKSSEFTLQHIRASKEQFTSEIEANGFRFVEDVAIEGLEETFVRRFERI